MKTRMLMTLLASLLVALIALPALRADEIDQATLFSFNEPVRVPGQVLPAGSYWFALMNRGAYPRVVQIFRADDMSLVATIQTATAQRERATGFTEITLAEPGEELTSDAPAITKWFYPGDQVGHEFIYSADREKELQHEREQDLRVPFEAQSGIAAPSIAVP